MEHREEMNCGGDLCKEMLDVGCWRWTNCCEKAVAKR